VADRDWLVQGGTRARRWLGAWLAQAGLLAAGPEAFADGFTVRALAYPQLYGPAFQYSEVTGDEANTLTGAPFAFRDYVEGDSSLETGNFYVTTALAKAGPPASRDVSETEGIPIDVVRGFAYAEAASKVNLWSAASPYQGADAWPIWGSEAQATSSVSGGFAIDDPAAGPLMPFQLGFGFDYGWELEGAATTAIAGVTGSFYVDDNLYYSFSYTRNSTSGAIVLVDGALASEFDVLPFRYEEGKPVNSYLSLNFQTPPGTYRFDVSAAVFVDNGLVEGDAGSFGKAWATIDPFVRVDPEWEYAHLVQVDQLSSIAYDGNPLGGTAGEQFWAEYDTSAVPEPGTGLLAGLGLVGIAWTRRRRELRRALPL
jgi:hypothetical protein